MKSNSFAAWVAAGVMAILVGSTPAAAAVRQRTAPVKPAPLMIPSPEIGADLAIALSASPWDPEESSELVYTITVTNLGKSAGSSAIVTSPLSDFVAWSDGADDCQELEAAVVCTLEPLAGGESRQLWFALEVLEPYPAETVQETRLTANDPDPVTKNNIAWARTILDVEPPSVEGVRALFDDSARRLRACTQLATAPRRLEVTFSEAMKRGSTSRPIDSPDSYLIVRPGLDGVFSETSCAVAREDGLPSSDVYVEILGVEWDEENLTAELELDPVATADATSGRWRLIACGGLTDLAGNPLDGDQNGQGGDDAVVDFRVDQGNLIDNGHFDCSVDFWTAVGAEPEAFVLGEDAAGDPLSASALLETTGGPFTIGAGQCVVEPAPGTYEISALFRVSPTAGGGDFAPVVGTWVGVACSLYESSTCDGLTQLVDGTASASVAVPTDGAWSKLSARFGVPVTTGSVLCTVAASGEGEEMAFEFDGVRLASVTVAGEPFGGGLGTIQKAR